MLSVMQISDLTHFCVFNWSWGGVFPIYRKHTDVPIYRPIDFSVFQQYDWGLRWYLTLQGDNSLKSVERFDHMMFVCRFQASR